MNCVCFIAALALCMLYFLTSRTHQSLTRLLRVFMMKRYACTVLGLAAMALSAQAAQYQLAISAGMHSYADISLDGNARYGSYAGEINATVISGPVGGFTDTIQTFCVDLGINMSQTTYTYDAVSFSSIDQSSMTPPWSSSGSSASIGLAASKVWELYSADKSNQNAAAAQIAIWEILYDFNNVGLDGGRFTYNGDMATGIGQQAQYYLDNYSTSQNAYSGVIFLEQNDGGQSLLNPDPSFTPPAPDGGTTMLLIGLGMLGLEGLRRKIQK